MEQRTSRSNGTSVEIETETETQTDCISNGDEAKSSVMEGEIDSDRHGGGEVLESALDFKDVKSIKDFTVVVDGSDITSELPEHIRTKYYELCCSQKSYLHDHLHVQNHDLAVGIISETVEIFYAIKASNRTTTLRDNFPAWSKILSALQTLGMNVGFIRARLELLQSFVLIENRVREAKLKMLKEERLKAEEKIRDLERRLIDAKEDLKRSIDAEIEASKTS